MILHASAYEYATGHRSTRESERERERESVRKRDRYIYIERESSQGFIYEPQLCRHKETPPLDLADSYPRLAPN